jgi:hypothetical protein
MTGSQKSASTNVNQDDEASGDGEESDNDGVSQSDEGSYSVSQSDEEYDEVRVTTANRFLCIFCLHLICHCRLA